MLWLSSLDSLNLWLHHLNTRSGQLLWQATGSSRLHTNCRQEVTHLASIAHWSEQVIWLLLTAGCPGNLRGRDRMFGEHYCLSHCRSRPDDLVGVSMRVTRHQAQSGHYLESHGGMEGRWTRVCEPPTWDRSKITYVYIPLLGSKYFDCNKNFYYKSVLYLMLKKKLETETQKHAEGNNS